MRITSRPNGVNSEVAVWTSDHANTASGVNVMSKRQLSLLAMAVLLAFSVVAVAALPQLNGETAPTESETFAYVTFDLPTDIVEVTCPYPEWNGCTGD
jgi:hypothetical protein